MITNMIRLKLIRRSCSFKTIHVLHEKILHAFDYTPIKSLKYSKSFNTNLNN
jgi:hypothetical protein